MPIIYTLVLLFCFGCVWEYLVTQLETAGVEGHTWELVVGGVAVTLIIAGHHIGWFNVLLLLVCFAASGAPMIVGAVRRHHVKWSRFIRRIQGIYDGRQQAAPARDTSAPDHQ
jgi:hypothetical protein